MEIKTKIRYLIIWGYHTLPYKIMITPNYKISYLSFNFNRKSTYILWIELYANTRIDSLDTLKIEKKAPNREIMKVYSEVRKSNHLDSFSSNKF